MVPLPVDPFLQRIVDDVRRTRAAVIVAAPGAGKTTRVPPALVGDGPGRLHPIDIAYRPGESVANAVQDVWAATRGDVLCFLPGAPEIRRAMADIGSRFGRSVDVLPLHGSLDAAEQDAAVGPAPRRRVIVAPNIEAKTMKVLGDPATVIDGLYQESLI